MVHNYQLSRADFYNIYDMIKVLDLDKKMKIKGMSTARADVFPCALSVIKAFVKEAKELWAFKKLNKNNEDANVEFVKASTLLHILIHLLVQSVMCLILGYGGYLVYIDTDNTFTIGKLIEFMSYFGSCIWPMMAISMLVDLSSRGKASLNRVSEFLDYKNNIIDKDVLDINYINGDIEFRNLTFSYPDSNEEVLKDISFKIKQGENIGVIGKTGCGKTTQIPQLIYNHSIQHNKVPSIIITQPRRLAATTISRRLCKEMNFSLKNGDT